LPGLALGLWAWHAPPDVPGHAALTSTSALLLIVVNLFNLLPVSPLDGGRLVERVLLAPWPTGAWVFKAASAGAFVLVGLLTEEGLVTAIGLVVAASLPAGIRAARVARRRATVGPPPDRAGLYALVDAAGYSGLRFGRKLALVQTLEQQFATPPATPLVRRLWLLVYVGVLGAGLHGARGLFG
jgi:Zn-dependent protease